MKKTRFLVQAAAIAAIYVVLTLVFAPISYGETLVEFRIAEALTVLPFLPFQPYQAYLLVALLQTSLARLGPLI